jgi:hypothetical protein
LLALRPDTRPANEVRPGWDLMGPENFGRFPGTFSLLFLMKQINFENNLVLSSQVTVEIVNGCLLTGHQKWMNTNKKIVCSKSWVLNLLVLTYPQIRIVPLCVPPVVDLIRV